MMNDLDELAGGVRGKVLWPGDDGCDAARTVWNARIDRRPAVIVRCAGAADVIAALAYARAHRPFYTLHVWIWKENPGGMFAPFSPRVTCS